MKMTTLNEVSGRLLADLLRKGHRAGPWHGPATMELITHVDADAARKKPVDSAHSIWEIVQHMRNWHDEVLQRLRGRPSQDPDGGDWPAVSGEWDAVRRSLSKAVDAGAAEIEKLSSEELMAFPSEPRVRASGADVTRAELVIGLIQHDAYHSGQIAYILKALRSGA
jgi:uncharacterized damage-inducible protein DinB